MNKTLDLLTQHRIAAVIRLPQMDHAVDLARALVAGGIRVLEFTLTTPNAIPAIGQVKAAFAGADVAIGAGTVTALAQVYAVVEAGADFIVSPITNPDIIALSKEAGRVIMPGAYTPTEIQSAWERGADVVKVFPARSLGAPFFKDVLAALPHLKLMPTGGVDLSNMQAYLRAGAVAVGIGGGFMDKDAILAQDWAKITQLAQEYSDLAKQL